MAANQLSEHNSIWTGATYSIFFVPKEIGYHEAVVKTVADALVGNKCSKQTGQSRHLASAGALLKVLTYLDCRRTPAESRVC
jgi:hypothetical protein